MIAIAAIRDFSFAPWLHRRGQTSWDSPVKLEYSSLASNAYLGLSAPNGRAEEEGIMGRKKQFAESINLSLEEGSKAAMDAALEIGEDRLALIRVAIARELDRRSRKKKMPPKNENIHA